MRPPLWILNSALLLLVIMALLFVLFSRQSLPEWEDISPSSYGSSLKKKAPEINISKIYEHDLFDTYTREIAQPTTPDFVVAIPEPPPPRPVQVPEIPKPQFLEPLAVVLKGIVFVHNDDSKNRIILSDTKTKKETLFKVGDAFEDAQLIKIFNKKAIFLRSNGQQEVLYLRAKDAQLDPAYAVIDGWKDVVQKITGSSYKISPREFIKRITTLAQFIDLFDLTTVHQQGQSIGCRVGKIAQDSIAHELGFAPGDIITSINTIEVTDAQNRFRLYKQIVAMQTNETIHVDLIRNKQKIQMTFTLEDFKSPPPINAQAKEEPLHQEPAPTPEQLKLLQERHKFAPTLQDIRERERQHMLRRNRKTLTSQFTE